jgi:tRNA threonylcarbamoyladenosine biosynthesis protein TsaB
MRILTIETSTPDEIVAVVEGDEVLAERRSIAGRGCRDELVGSIGEVLDRSGTKLTGLGAIAVSIGPGRFTGLRVGLATAKALAVTSGVGVRAVGTLPALALSSGVDDGLVCPALDARRGEVYASLLRAGGTAIVMEAAALPPAALADRVRALAAGSSVTFVGTGAIAYRDELSALLGGAALFGPDDVTAPTPRALAMLALEEPSRHGADLIGLEPVYLRGVSPRQAGGGAGGNA